MTRFIAAAFYGLTIAALSLAGAASSHAAASEVYGPPLPGAGDSAIAPHDVAPKTRAERLDDLFARLAVSKDVDEAQGLIGAINRLSMQSGSDTADLLMSRASAAMAKQDYATAVPLLDSIVTLQPDWAEAWNKRATLRYLRGDARGSMADIAQTLKREPRHFGALSGMGMILEQMGLRDDALKAYSRALEVAPELPAVKEAVDRLKAETAGQAL